MSVPERIAKFYKEKTGKKKEEVNPVSDEPNAEIMAAIRPFVLEYSVNIKTPDLINSTWQGIWQEIGKTVGFNYRVPLCNRSKEELLSLEKEGRAVLLLPEDIFTQEGLERLGRAFPDLRCWPAAKNQKLRISQLRKGGCVDIEMDLEAPYRSCEGSNLYEAVGKIAYNNKYPQRLSTYIMGSQFSKALTGEYFDTDTYSWLAGSSFRDNSLSASFMKDGRCVVDANWGPRIKFSSLGARSESFGTGEFI